MFFSIVCYIINLTLEGFMDIRKLKYLSISNLILIILNKDYSDTVRKCAEVELRKRIKHLGIEYKF